MEKYKQKTVFASAADRVLRIFAAVLAGILWFVWLWGLSLMSLISGTALGILFWLCLRLLGKKQLQKKEQQMRILIGGELALDKLLMLPGRHAAFLAALWLSPKVPLVMQRTVENGVSGTLNQEPALIWLRAQHKSTEIGVDSAVEALKEAHKHQAKRLFFCATAPVSKALKQFLEQADISVRIVTREELLFLAGACNPATDEQLVSLKKRNTRKRTVQDWLCVILSPQRTKRYLTYGLGLSGLYIVFRQPFYPIPAAICFLLFALSLIYRKKLSSMPW